MDVLVIRALLFGVHIRAHVGEGWTCGVLSTANVKSGLRLSIAMATSTDGQLVTCSE